MRYLVLGHLEVHGADGPIALGSPKERRLLAVLVSQRGKVVSADELVDAIWDGLPPRSAAKTLQGYVVHLRQALETGGAAPESPIVTRPAGYELTAPVSDVDADLFRDLTNKGRRAAQQRDFGTARVLLREALGLWRGAAYADFPLVSRPSA